MHVADKSLLNIFFCVSKGCYLFKYDYIDPVSMIYLSVVIGFNSYDELTDRDMVRRIDAWLAILSEYLAQLSIFLLSF